MGPQKLRFGVSNSMKTKPTVSTTWKMPITKANLFKLYNVQQDNYKVLKALRQTCGWKNNNLAKHTFNDMEEWKKVLIKYQFWKLEFYCPYWHGGRWYRLPLL